MKTSLYFFLFWIMVIPVFSQFTDCKTTVNGLTLKYADLLASGNMVQSNAVGIAGFKPIQAYYFDSLKEYSTPYELHMLTNYTNPVVRCYAFKALIQIDYSNDLVGILRVHEMDTSRVSCQSGCMVMSRTVIDYMLYSIPEKRIVNMSIENREYIINLKSRVRRF